MFRATTPHGPMLAVACRDITDNVRAAADREAQQRAQRDFVANAAHELRTPLTAVIAAIETLDRGAIHDPAGRERFFGHIRREAARLSRLCDSLLLLADTQSGSPQRATTTRLRPMLDDIAAGLTAAPGVTVTVEAPADLSVTTNPGLLERILDNLTQNAAKYTARGQIALHASTAGAAVTVTVQDTGQGLGLPAAEAVKRFSRGGARTADGFGLGLSIAHQAALALGATLYLHDNPGGGTIASLTLPHAPPASASILVIEDEDAIRDAITYTLRTAGYQVTEAATGQHGLAAARQEHFDLIIIDLLLPDIPGTDLTRQLRADEGSESDGDGRRILAVTAQTTDGTRDLALSAGADQFMTKPFAMSQLLEQARALTAPPPPDALHPAQHRTSAGPAGGGHHRRLDPAMSMLHAVVTAGPSGPVIALAGEADLTTAAELNQVLAAQLDGGTSRLTVDLSGLRFADSAAILQLIRAHRAITGRGGTLELTRPQPAVARVLSLLGVDQVLTVRGQAEAAGT